jgi:hypothetical protein
MDETLFHRDFIDLGKENPNPELSEECAYLEQSDDEIIDYTVKTLSAVIL